MGEILDPDVNVPTEEYDTRSDAVAGATELATRFVDGKIDYRTLYQVPRPEYFEKLDELTNGDSDATRGT